MLGSRADRRLIVSGQTRAQWLAGRMHLSGELQADSAQFILPEGAVFDGNGWKFAVPEGGADELLARLVSAGHGVAGLSLERPALHEAFVYIVSEARRADSGSAA